MRSLTRDLRLDEPSPTALARVVFLLYLIGECATDSRYAGPTRLLLTLASLSGILSAPLSRRSFFWGGVTALMLVNVIAHYFSAANHHFLTVYVSGYFLVEAVFRERQLRLPINVPRVLLVLTFFFATVHKLLSSFFMSGRLIATFSLARGTLKPVFSKIFPDYGILMAAYHDAYQAVANGALLGTPVVPLEGVPPAFVAICLGISWSIVAAEGALFAMLAFNRLFYARLLPFVMFVFVWGTFLFREEVFFFALLCAVFVMALPRLGLVWRWAFVVSAVFFIAFGITGLRTL